MADIRKRVGKKGTTYQVRYPNTSTKSGYAFKSFDTLKEARTFLESGKTQARSGVIDPSVASVPEAIDRWLDICLKEGRDGRDPVTDYTHKTYVRRSEIMKAFDWSKPLAELQTPDVVAFRSWLLRSHSRDLARKTLTSFHAVIKEMALRGNIASNFASGVAIRADSRYDAPVVIPTIKEVAALLAAADRLANSKNAQIAKSWLRYRPIMYLAADSGMRPQEYLAIARAGLRDGGVSVERAIERGGRKISVPKTPAGRRFIELSPDTFAMVTHYARNHAVKNKYDLVFPTSTGRWQETDNWRNRAFYKACIEAGLVREERNDKGALVAKPRFSPYDLRHFYASMLIEQRFSLKRIQSLMGHEDIKTTLNVYGHLIEEDETPRAPNGLLSRIPEFSSDKHVLQGTSIELKSYT